MLNSINALMHSLVLRGTKGEREKLRDFMLWDVANGVSRRSWAGGKNAK